MARDVLISDSVKDKTTADAMCAMPAVTMAASIWLMHAAGDKACHWIESRPYLYMQ